MLPFALHVVALVVMPLFLMGVIQRVKALWSGRRGPPLMQPAFDIVRLLRKSSVYSETTTLVFRLGPWVFLICAVGSAVITPVLGGAPIASFPFDFVWFAYVWGLGRVALMLAALDTGSSFEGMGAAREATFATLLEPALFLVAGALCLSTGTNTLSGAIGLHMTIGDASPVVWLSSVVALLVVLQVETARMPVDDPSTHLELTMIHEVMVLDHSGPELAAIQFGSALKVYVGASLVACLLSPWVGSWGAPSALIHLGLTVLVAVAVGTAESLIARLQLRVVPKYIAAALASATVALLATAWHAGVAR